jgi:predicted enzyme related to lactoylglutathione lyase
MSSIVLWVSDINRQAEFYSALLDAQIAEKSDEFCSVSNQENSVLLHLLPAQYRVTVGTLTPAQEEVAIKPIFSVSSIKESIARAQSKNVRTLGNLTRYNSAAYQDCIDPEGNVIQLIQSK